MTSSSECRVPTASQQIDARSPKSYLNKLYLGSGFSTEALLTFGARSFFIMGCCGVVLVHCKMFGIICSLNPLRASIPTTVTTKKMSPDIFHVFRKGQNHVFSPSRTSDINHWHKHFSKYMPRNTNTLGHYRRCYKKNKGILWSNLKYTRQNQVLKLF